ncbi:unnamed protein product, partial [Iphiclides podalirius]
MKRVTGQRITNGINGERRAARLRPLASRSLHPKGNILGNYSELGPGLDLLEPNLLLLLLHDAEQRPRPSGQEHVAFRTRLAIELGAIDGPELSINAEMAFNRPSIRSHGVDYWLSAKKQNTPQPATRSPSPIRHFLPHALSKYPINLKQCHLLP